MLRTIRLAALASGALLSAAPLPAQTARYTLYGSGCGPVRPPAMIVTGVPRLGGSFTVELGTTWCRLVTLALVTGARRVSRPVFGCTLLASPDAVAVPRSRPRVTIRVPADPSLRGARFYQQWLAWTTCINFFYLETTRGGEGLIGQ